MNTMQILLHFSFIIACTFTALAANALDAPNRKFQANDEWKTMDMSDIQVKKGSALDLSSVSAVKLDAAGRLPRLTIGNGGKLVAENRPKIPLRLRGFNFNSAWFLWGLRDYLQRDEAEAFAKLVRRQGYNAIRIGADAIPMDERFQFATESIDKLDFLISKLAAEGVYLYVPIFAYGNFEKDFEKAFRLRDENKLKMYLGDHLMRERWTRAVEALMAHVNPYSGLAWKDDPSIACVEFYNEQEICLNRLGKISPETQGILNARFQQWLKTKYKTPEALSKAWRNVSIDAFTQVNAPKNRWAANDVKTNDFLLFFSDLSRENIEWFEHTIRATGYTGLTAQYNCNDGLDDIEVRFESSQVAIANKYFNHPSAFSEPGSKCGPDSSVGSAASYWCTANATHFPDRPFFITEYNHAFWNSYQHECGILFGAYSAFQGIDALFVHSDAVLMKAMAGIDSFTVATNPISRASEFLTACLYLRGDIQTTQHQVSLRIPQKYLEMNCTKAVSSEQAKIGLLSGFNIDFPWAKRPQGISVAEKPDIVIEPSKGAEIKTSDWFVDVVDSKDEKFSLDAFIVDMKAKGLLPKSSLSAPSEGIFQNATGEIVLRAKENLLKVATSRSEAVTLEGGKGEVVGQLAVLSTSVPALVAACAMDGESLAKSKRIVIIYSTEAANSGMELSPDRKTLVKLGKRPILIRTGKLLATLANANMANMSLYALAMNGERREKLPVSMEANLLKIELDTASMKDGPAIFFELIVEKAVSMQNKHVESLLPKGKSWTLVWHDEFDGDTLDESKWSYRLHLMQKRHDTFSDGGCIIDGKGHILLPLIEKDGQFFSPQLQTGSNFMDRPGSVPCGPKFKWPIGKIEEPKFLHGYGYYECRCKLPTQNGWWAAFWLQSPIIGSTLDPKFSGVEVDIMETFTHNGMISNKIITHNNHWSGYGDDYKTTNNSGDRILKDTPDGFHVFGLDWSPDGYTYYIDGERSWHVAGPVSGREQFILISTECKGYRDGDMPCDDLKNAKLPDYFIVDYVRVFDEVKHVAQ